MVSDFSLFFSCSKDVICFSFLEEMKGETAWMAAFKNSGRLLRVKCAVVEREVYQKVTKACVTSVSSYWRHSEGVFAVRGGLKDVQAFKVSLVIIYHESLVTQVSTQKS